MRTLVLSYAEVQRLLDFPGLVPVMRATLEDLSAGRTLLPPRQVLEHPSHPGLIAWMPALAPGGKLFGSKVVSVYPENRRQGMNSHQGVVVLFSPSDGHVEAILDADAVTAARTAAVTAAATDFLARPDAQVLALLGSGGLAEAHLPAMLAVRPIREVRVWSATTGHAEDFARRAGARYGGVLRVAVDAREAVEGADIVCTLTSARKPVLPDGCVAAGAHVNAVGAAAPGYGEIEPETMGRSRVFVDSREHCLREADDVRLPLAAGQLAEEDVTEVGDAFAGRREGRTSDAEVTLFKSVGLAIEDLAAANYCLLRAEEVGIGHWVGFSGQPFAG